MNRTDKAILFFTSQPHIWHQSVTLEQFGRNAWRTRISEARIRLKTQGSLTNRLRKSSTGIVISEYRYSPYRSLLDMMGRDETAEGRADRCER